eukprot:1156018-Pelagomonas_calceolata.AAC.1
MTRGRLLDRIKVALAGHVAVRIVLGQETNTSQPGRVWTFVLCQGHGERECSLFVGGWAAGAPTPGICHPLWLVKQTVAWFQPGIGLQCSWLGNPVQQGAAPQLLTEVNAGGCLYPAAPSLPKL